MKRLDKYRCNALFTGFQAPRDWPHKSRTATPNYTPPPPKSRRLPRNWLTCAGYVSVHAVRRCPLSSVTCFRKPCPAIWPRHKRRWTSDWLIRRRQRRHAPVPVVSRCPNTCHASNTATNRNPAPAGSAARIGSRWVRTSATNSMSSRPASSCIGTSARSRPAVPARSFPPHRFHPP